MLDYLLKRRQAFCLLIERGEGIIVKKNLPLGKIAKKICGKFALYGMVSVFSATGLLASTEAAVQNETFQKDKSVTQKQYKAREVIVKYKKGAFNRMKAASHAIYGSKKIEKFSNLHMELITLREGVSVEEAISKYQHDPNVEYAEPNYAIRINATFPDDAFFSELWGLYNSGQTGGTPGADIRAADAWDLTTGNDNLIVAVLDTGIDYNHPDIVGNLWVNSLEVTGNEGVDDDGNGYIDDIYGIDTYNQDSDPMDDHGHGTHVSGTIGAVGNNGIGVAGVNWNVKVLNCKFLDSGGSGYTDGAIRCLDYIKGLKDRGENIVATNNSWGCSGCYSQALVDAIDAQKESGILFIAAAGNVNGDNDEINNNINYPSSYGLPNIIAVAATDNNDDKASFSSYGRQSVDIGAPGVDIVSLRAAGTNMLGNGNYLVPAGDPNAEYLKASGTSMATPHVAGLAALIQSHNLNMDWPGIRNLILSGGDEISSMNGVTVTGKRVNAYGSLNCTNSPLISALQYPKIPESYVVGTPIVISALSIDCALPAGSVTVTTSGGNIISLSDNGANPDSVAGDGIFTGVWIPTEPVDTLVFSSPAGTDTVNIPAYPDLVMTALSGGPAAAETGQTFQMPNTVKNQGDRAAKSFRIGLYLSPDENITTDDILIGSRSLGKLAPGGAESTVTWTKATIPAGTASGTYYLGAIADYENAIDEIIAESNNSLTGNQIVISEVYADVAVTALSGPAMAAPGQQIPVGYTIKNQGSGRAWQSFSIGFYLSTDNIITTDDIYLGAPGWFGSMFAGSEFEQTDLLVTIPDSVAEGVYYLGAIADAYGFVVNESNPANNALAGGQINISSQAPDLAPVSLTAGINNTDQLTVTVEIENQGQLNANATVLGIYLSSDTSITTDDYLIGIESIDSLHAGASTLLTATKTILHTVPNGVYYAGVIADYENALFEIDDANNSFAGNQVTVNLPSIPELPDLIVSDFAAPAVVSRASYLISTVSLTNQGPVDSNYSRCRVYLSNDAVWSADDRELDDFGEYGLMAGKTMSRTVSGWINEEPGDYYIIAVADADSDMDEGNEDNNIFVHPLTVQ